MKHILFVCTGNSCRSIMAEAYMLHRAKEEALDVEIKSAGTLGIEGMDPTAEALDVLREEGISGEGFSSSGLTEELIDWADLILVMEPRHRDKVLYMSPAAQHKVKLLSEFSTKAGIVSIKDPVGMPLGFYRESFKIIKEPIEGLIEWLKK